MTIPISLFRYNTQDGVFIINKNIIQTYYRKMDLPDRIDIKGLSGNIIKFQYFLYVTSIHFYKNDFCEIATSGKYWIHVKENV